MAFNIEADPREMHNVVVENSWVMRPYLATLGAYQATLEKHPNPPAANLTKFQGDAVELMELLFNAVLVAFVMRPLVGWSAAELFSLACQLRLAWCGNHS